MSAPQTDTASPAAKMFFPALMSRSIPMVLQLGQSQLRIFKGSFSTTKPQWLYRLLLGKNRSILTSFRPYHWHLYSSCRKNSPQAASDIDLASLRFFTMFLTPKSSVESCLTYYHILCENPSWRRRFLSSLKARVSTPKSDEI